MIQRQHCKFSNTQTELGHCCTNTRNRATEKYEATGVSIVATIFPCVKRIISPIERGIQSESGIDENTKECRAKKHLQGMSLCIR